MVVDLVAVGFPVVVCRTRSGRYESLYLVANNRQSRCWMARFFDCCRVICRFFSAKKVFYSVSCLAMVNGPFAKFSGLGERTTRS